MRRILTQAALVLACAAVTAAGLTAQTTVHPLSGRRIAQVMGYQGVPWLERDERKEEESPDLAVSELKIPAGATVADIGAGSGYMTVRLSKAVGPAGRVFANDIQPQMLSILGRRLSSAGIANVTLVQGGLDDPRLPESTMDLELMVDVYHEFSRPQAMLRGLRSALKPDGRMVLVEYRKEDMTIPILYEHKMSVTEAKVEVEAEGFTLAQVSEVLPRQHILIFTKKPS